MNGKGTPQARLDRSLRRYVYFMMSAAVPDLILSQTSGGKPGAQTGEGAGQDAADRQERQIDEDARGVQDHHGDADLSEVVEHGTDDADKNQLFFSEEPEQKSHGSEAEESAAKTVGKRYHLSGHHTGERDAHQQYTQGVLPAGIVQKPERHHICKSELDAGNRGERRKHRFHHKDRQRDRRVHGKKGHMFYFHTNLHSAVPVDGIGFDKTNRIIANSIKDDKQKSEKALKIGGNMLVHRRKKYYT